MTSIDVIIPNFQYGRYLRDAALSVLTQDVKDLRLLIIDNASTDDSVEVARRLAREDARVEVIENQVNVGRISSFNRGFDWAQAKYVTSLCSDDRLAPGSLKRAFDILEQNADIGCAHGKGVDVWTGEAPLLPKECSAARWRIVSGMEFIKERCDWPPKEVGFTLVRTDVQKKAGYLRPAVRYADDLEMALRLACYGAVACTDAIQGVRLQHGASVSSGYWNDMEQWIGAIDEALESFFAHEGSLLPDADRLRKLAKRNLGAGAYWSAVSHLLRGYPRQSASLFRFAFAASRSFALLPPVGHLSRRSGVVRRLREILTDRRDVPASETPLEKDDAGLQGANL